ncbi:MAG: O-antigen ligase family protein, partial [Oscillospiraceae bacterium]|nr:O-antigen ligase family protein [Oscillospiraceae bacterium]
LYAFVYIIATFTSVTVSGSLLGGALTTFFVLFAFVIQNSVTTRRSLDALIYAFVVSGALVSAYGVFQYVFGSTRGASAWLDSEMFEGIVRIYSTLGNPNVLAKYLLLVTPFAGACIFMVKGALPKLFFTGCLGAMLLCMLLTFSRGGWLGLIVAAAIFLVMLDRRFILVGIIGIVILYFALPDVILDRFLSIGNLGDTSTSYRVSIWLGTINMLRDFWFTGIGPGTAAFNTIYPLYSFNTIISPHSHNLYLQIMCDAGIAGILVFLAVIFTYFRNLCRAISREHNKSSKILQIAAISGVFGFLVQGMTDYSFYNYRVTLVFWAVLGLGALAARRSGLTHKE